MKQVQPNTAAEIAITLQVGGFPKKKRWTNNASIKKQQQEKTAVITVQPFLLFSVFSLKLIGLHTSIDVSQWFRSSG